MSDPLPGGGRDAATWIAPIAEIAGAAFLAWAPWSLLRNNPLDGALTTFQSEHGSFTDAELKEAGAALGLAKTDASARR